MEQTEGLAWIGEESGTDAADAGDGRSGGAYVEDLFIEDPPGSWRHGANAIGTAHIRFVLTPTDKAACTMTFSFDGNHGLTAQGDLPYEEGMGGGVIPVTGATGHLNGKYRRLRVEVRNPHKYTPEP